MPGRSCLGKSAVSVGAFLIMLGGFQHPGGAYGFGFEKLPTIADPRAVTVRRHIRRHRHIHLRKSTRPELGQAESIKAPVAPAPSPRLNRGRYRRQLRPALRRSQKQARLAAPRLQPVP